MKKLFPVLTITSALALAACGERSEKVDLMKRSDKQLSCKEILLEINEAEFYKKQADDKKSLGIKSIVMPIGYIDTYMSADEAITAANSRVDYLNRIYDIKNCEANGGIEIINNNQYVAPKRSVYY